MHRNTFAAYAPLASDDEPAIGRASPESPVRNAPTSAGTLHVQERDVYASAAEGGENVLADARQVGSVGSVLGDARQVGSALGDARQLGSVLGDARQVGSALGDARQVGSVLGDSLQGQGNPQLVVMRAGNAGRGTMEELISPANPMEEGNAGANSMRAWNARVSPVSHSSFESPPQFHGQLFPQYRELHRLLPYVHAT